MVGPEKFARLEAGLNVPHKLGFRDIVGYIQNPRFGCPDQPSTVAGDRQSSTTLVEWERLSSTVGRPAFQNLSFLIGEMSVTSETETEADSEGTGCPQCGSPALYREPMCEHGSEDQVTSGTACADCMWYELDEQPTPDLPEEGVIREGAIDLGPFGETRTTHPNFDADRCVYVDRGGCPECGDDLEIVLTKNRKAPYSIQPEFRAMADICVNYEDGDSGCSHRAP